jgi:ribosomal protein L37AE/L43A
MINESRKEAAAEESNKVTQCPECAFAPLRENESGDLLCPICGWSITPLSRYQRPRRPFDK